MKHPGDMCPQHEHESDNQPVHRLRLLRVPQVRRWHQGQHIAQPTSIRRPSSGKLIQNAQIFLVMSSNDLFGYCELKQSLTYHLTCIHFFQSTKLKVSPSDPGDSPTSVLGGFLLLRAPVLRPDGDPRSQRDPTQGPDSIEKISFEKTN